MKSSLRAARDVLAATGEMRVAINLGNPVLAQRNNKGDMVGVSVDLALDLAKYLEVVPRLMPFEAAGLVAALALDDVWDLAFLARDPKRAESILFTRPYVLIEGTFLVPRAATHGSVRDLDKRNARISVGQGAAYDLFLTRTLQLATLVRAPTSAAAIDLFVTQELDAAAGVRQPLENFAASNAKCRVLPDSFTQIEQAMAIPHAHRPALYAVENYLEAKKRDGFIEGALKKSGQNAAIAAGRGGNGGGKGAARRA